MYAVFTISIVIFTPSQIDRGMVLFSINFFFVCIFVCFFVSLLARLRGNGWTNFHEIFREGVELPWDNSITFLVNSEKPRDAQHAGGVCCAFTPQLVIVILYSYTIFKINIYNAHVVDR